MRWRNVFSVDGVILPTPDEYKPMVAVKDYYEFTWNYLSWEDCAKVMNAVDGKTQVVLTYFDPRVPNRLLSNVFYVGRRSCAANNINDPVRTWKDISLQFTRV